MKWSDRLQALLVILAAIVFFAYGGNWPWILLLTTLLVGFLFGEPQNWQGWVEGLSLFAGIIILVLYKDDLTNGITVGIVLVISIFANFGDILQNLAKGS